MQRFKSVYFPDHPAPTTKARNLKIAFGPGDEGVYSRVSLMSSEEIRSLLGYAKLADLRASAAASGQTINSFCLQQLRRLAEQNARQYTLPEIPSVEPRLRIDPIQATFRGGLDEPLHAWYPYLEGYSPDFVETVLSTYAPDARHVLDPFAGAGTTPLTAASGGMQASYCELNPLLQYLIEAKTTALTAPIRTRQAWIEQLSRARDCLTDEVPAHGVDIRLQNAYTYVFGDSEFFSRKTFREILQLRTWLDSLVCSTPAIVPFVTIAVLASLIPASHLIRKGDLRFRKGESELKQGAPSLLPEVSRRIEAISSDLQSLECLAQRPSLVASDAKLLASVPHLGVDAIVTSPPYLNGTNYYRNTKVELWFLRALSRKADLAHFRQTTITAGINDVTAGKINDALHPLVTSVLKELESSAYDRRIPRMVEGYFSDMGRVFNGLARHTKPGSPLLLDIGDSDYGGVKVDTPTILSEMLRDRGWKVRDEVVLRNRLSKGGGLLRQVLLVADSSRILPSSEPTKAKWQSKWGQFIRELPHQKGEFAKRNWGSPLHSLCSYQGKMKPALAHHLVKTFVNPGDRLLDPFGGVGTIPFEAAVLGARTWSFDISPAAVPIALAKLSSASLQDCTELIDDLAQFIQRYRPTSAELEETARIKFNGRLSDYFHPQTFKEILAARSYFRETPPNTASSALVFASLLHVLHGNRPYALSRRSHPITPFAPTGEAVYKSVIEKVTEKVAKVAIADRGPRFQPGTSMFQDATGSWPADVSELDAVITSPPFFDSTRFYLANWMRLWFAGWTDHDFRSKPKAFVDERQKESFNVYKPILRQAKERLVSGGVCVIHLGKSKKCDMAPIVADLAKTWFGRVQMFSESVDHCESHGIRDKGTVVEHTYLVVQ